MIALIASVIIALIFASKAKERNKNIFKWVLIGLTSFWLTAFLPVYFIIEFVIGPRSDFLGIILILATIFTFLIAGGIICNRFYKKLKRSEDRRN